MERVAGDNQTHTARDGSAQSLMEKRYEKLSTTFKIWSCQYLFDKN